MKGRNQDIQAGGRPCSPPTSPCLKGEQEGSNHSLGGTTQAAMRLPQNLRYCLLTCLHEHLGHLWLPSVKNYTPLLNPPASPTARSQLAWQNLPGRAPHPRPLARMGGAGHRGPAAHLQGRHLDVWEGRHDTQWVAQLFSSCKPESRDLPGQGPQGGKAVGTLCEAGGAMGRVTWGMYPNSP